MNDWDEYQAHETRLVSDVRAELKSHRSISLQPYHALHLPFVLKELYDISATHSKQIKENAMVFLFFLCFFLNVKRNNRKENSSLKKETQIEKSKWDMYLMILEIMLLVFKFKICLGFTINRGLRW